MYTFIVFALLVCVSLTSSSSSTSSDNDIIVLSEEDHRLSKLLREDHWHGRIFHYEEELHIRDSESLRDYYRQIVEADPTDRDALYELSLIEGGFGHRNDRAATPSMNASWDYLQSSAQLGHPAALHKLATSYFTGLYGAYSVPIDIGRSLVLDQVAAIQGYFAAHVSLGYKHFKGIGVTQNCEKALLHYEYAANFVIENLFKRGYAVQNERLHISQAERKSKEMRPEVLDYYHQAAVEGDIAVRHTYIHQHSEC
jgi:TPR repeat protein